MRWLGALVAAPLLAAGAVQADPPDSSGPASPPAAPAHSAYERSAIDTALATLALAREPSPEGKVVEAIHVVRLEVIEASDPAPRLLNALHVLTRESVIAREVLLRPGEEFHQALADETQRNLASLPQLSLALVLPVQGSAPDRVGVLVVTKDVWSLRVAGSFTYTSGGLESLTLRPSETNLLGRRQTLGLDFGLLPLSYDAGGRFVAPGIGASHVVFSTAAGIIVERDTGRREGSRGSLQLGEPLWSTRSRWSWTAGGAWLDEVTRRYSDARLVYFRPTPDTDCTAPMACVPFAYRSRLTVAKGELTRSLGEERKHDLTLGVEARWSQYRVLDAAAYDPAAVQAFVDRYVPVSEDRLGAYVQHRTYANRYLRTLDLETLALQEDHRLGPELVLRGSAFRRVRGEPAELVGLSAGLWHTVALGDGLVRAGALSATEWEVPGGHVGDGSITAALRAVSPRLAPGRIVLDAELTRRYANERNITSTLGGDTRLRGFPTNHFIGPDLVAANLELRTIPVRVLHSLHVAGVAFYDVGDAFDGWDGIHLWHSTGVGLRILVPQVDRTVFRIDAGFPLARPLPPGVSRVGVFARLGQAFPMP